MNLYMFRATMCPSSREKTVFMQHLVLVIMCGAGAYAPAYQTVIRTE